MSFFVAILYTAILGVLFEHSFAIHPNTGPTGNAIRVDFFIKRDNSVICTFLFLLFIIDWVCFHLLFGTTDSFRLDLFNGWLLLLYLPATFSLGLTVIFSYERIESDERPRFCLTAGFYHSLALLAELVWLIHRALILFPDKRIPVSLCILLLLYLAFRGFIAYSYFIRYFNPKVPVRPEILGFSAAFMKPAFLLLVSYSTPGLLLGGR